MQHTKSHSHQLSKKQNTHYYPCNETCFSPPTTHYTMWVQTKNPHHISH